MRTGDEIGGRFLIETLAGQGGMAAVWRGRDKVTGAPVAIKVLLRSTALDVQRFHREAAVLEGFDHPSIVKPLHHGNLDDGTPYIVMEWLEGIDLATRLEKGPLDVASVVMVGMRIASALAAAHERGIIHRDVKPSNVILVGGTVEGTKVIDFGVVRAAEAPGGTATGLVVGTPGYMSPEQARGDRTLDARSDVFALGCVLYECIAGIPPFVGDHPVAVLAKILMAEPARLSIVRGGVPADLDDLVTRMLSKPRDGRPANGSAVLAELQRIAASNPEARTSRPSTLTEHEQQVVSIVLVLAEPDTSTAETLSPEQMEQSATRAQKAVTSLGALYEVTVDGSVVALPLADSPTDKAALAARCALALKRAMPGRTIVIATGRALVSRAGLPMGRVIDEAIALARNAHGRESIVVDEATRSLLDARFDLAGDELVGERSKTSGRTLLGKRTQLVGRARELSTLLALFEESSAERSPRAVLVTGSPGVGKTRLSEELLESVASWDPPPLVLSARGDPVAAGSAFGIASQLVRAFVGADESESPDQQLQRIARTIPNAETAEFACELMRVANVKPSVRLAAARADAMVMGDQLTRAFVDVLDVASKDRPVLLLVDDLQWGDLPSVKLLNVALRTDAERPIFVLALARPDVVETFPALWTERHLTRIVLGGLPKRAAEQLVRSVLGGAADAQQIARIVGRAEGIPFSIEELVRAEARGQAQSPDTVLAMAQRRLEGLDPEARQVLRAASVFGPRFWKGGVLALVGQSKSRIADDTFERLARDEVIAPSRSSKLFGEQEFEFRHGIVQDAAYAMLTDADRELGHRLAAAWLVDKGEQDPMTLAVHAERGKDTRAAGAWYAMAAAEALDGIDLKGAIARAEQAIGCGIEGEMRGTARRIQAEASYWSGDFDSARRHADEALALVPAQTREWFDTASHAIATRARMGDTEATLAMFDIVKRATPNADAVGSRVQALARGASLLVFQGRADVAHEVLGTIEHDAMSVVGEQPGALARFYQCRALLASVAGDLGGYLEGSRSAAQLFLAAGDQRNELAQRANLADALVECGSYSAAVAAARDVEAGASRLGLANTVAHAQQNVGLALAMLGSFEEANRVQRAALAEFVRGDEKRLAGGCRIYLAQSALASGDLEAAWREGEEALRLLSATPPLRAYASAVLAQIALAKGEIARAREYADAALALLDELGGLESGTATVFLAAAETARASGDVARAAAIADRGANWVKARGGTLKDAALRESFFGKVRDNVRLLGLADELGRVQP